MSRADAENAMKAFKVCERDDNIGLAPPMAITPK
jgi:hypothetical protein